MESPIQHLCERTSCGGGCMAKFSIQLRADVPGLAADDMFYYQLSSESVT